MGNTSGSLARRIRRPFKMYNIDRRVEKALNKRKEAEPIPSPRHPGTGPNKLKIRTAPDENLLKKHDTLAKHLDKMSVQSHGTNYDIKPRDKTTGPPLPVRRDIPEDPAAAFVSSKPVPAGRMSLAHAINLITLHQNDPQTNTVDKLSKMYGITNQNIQNIVGSFAVFHTESKETLQLKVDKIEDVQRKALADKANVVVLKPEGEQESDGVSEINEDSLTIKANSVKAPT